MPQEQLSKIGNSSICPSAIIVKGGRILLGLRNYTPDKWKTISVWTTPGGRCDDNETIESALRREGKEEIDITDLTIRAFICETPGAKEGDTVPMFYCTTTEEPRLMEQEKFSEWRWVPIPEYVKGGSWSVMNPGGHKIVSEFLNGQNVNM